MMKFRLDPAALMALALAFAGCDKEKREREAEPTGSAGAEKTAPDPGTAGKASGAAGFEAPRGEGPHEGFDLAALHRKLQGTWMVGGTAFSSIPRIWHLDESDLVIVDGEGKRSEHTLRLLAPCYAAVAEKGGGSTVFSTFVFDGDTLYQGLGNAGVRQGERVVACMAAGIYELADDACTKWTRKPFASPGQPAWEKEPGECGFAEDGKVFFGDDTSSKRKIYGREQLEVIEGDALMTRQMAGNRAEKVASLEEALARQQAVRDEREEAKKTPEDLPFAGWGLAPADASYARGDRVWAAAVSRDGKWTFNVLRFEKAEGDVLTLKQTSDLWAPSAFTRAAADPEELSGGAPVMAAAGALVSYGRFVRGGDGKAVYAHLSGPNVREREVDAARIAAVPELGLGTPVAYRDGDRWRAGEAVHVQDERVLVLTRDGVQPIARADLRAIDGKPLRKGARVLALPSSGVAPLRFEPGRVGKVLEGGAAYEIETDDGKRFVQSWARVMPR
jgi:hypothetical protein